MVTTRQDAHYKEEQGGELTEENSVNVYVPESSSANGKGKKRSVVAEDGEGTLSRSAKKRKVAALSVREKEGDAIAKADGEGIVVRNTRLVVEIPVTKAMREIADKIEAEKKADSAKEGKKHKKFGSDDEGGEEEILSTARKAPVIKEMVEEESSDDEAPEEVGAQSAAEEVKIQEQSAQQAIQRYVSKFYIFQTSMVMLTKYHSLRKKRKERASKTQNKPKKLLNGENINTTDPLEALSDALDEAELQDSSSESDSESENEPMSRSNRTKFELTLDRAPKDRKVGTTTYRVTKVQTKNLAPKSGKRAKDTKEAWLQGRNGKKGLGALRKPVKKGFFN